MHHRAYSSPHFIRSCICVTDGVHYVTRRHKAGSPQGSLTNAGAPFLGNTPLSPRPLSVQWEIQPRGATHSREIWSSVAAARKIFVCWLCDEHRCFYCILCMQNAHNKYCDSAAPTSLPCSEVNTEQQLTTPAWKSSRATWVPLFAPACLSKLQALQENILSSHSSFCFWQIFRS